MKGADWVLLAILFFDLLALAILIGTWPSKDGF